MNNLIILKKYQKNRFFRKPKKILNKFGDCSLIIFKECNIELIQLSIIKFLLKNYLKKKKKSLQINEKIWYFGKPNFYLQKKSKNSRMGKGKGMLERQVIRLKKNHSLLEFKGFSKNKLKKFFFKLKKKTYLNIFLFFHNNNNKNYNLWCNNTKYMSYFNKYLLY